MLAIVSSDISLLQDSIVVHFPLMTITQYLLLHSTHVITGGMVLYTYGLALGSGYDTGTAILFSGALFIVVFSVSCLVY